MPTRNLPCNLDDAWSIVFDHYDPADEGRREALLALGNGYFVTRAAAPEAKADDIHYPGIYRAGLYNRLESHLEVESVQEESLVNLPNWLPLTFRIEGGDWFSVDQVEILSYRQTLDLRQGVLHREIQFCDRQGRQTRLHEQRLVSMKQPHLAGLQIELTAENWSGNIEIRSALDGQVENNNVSRYDPYHDQHLVPAIAEPLEPEGIWLMMRTSQSDIDITLAARTRVSIDDQVAELERTLDQEAAYMAERIQAQVEQGRAIAIEKIAALYTSRDLAISNGAEAAREAIQFAPNFNDLLDAHQRAWQQLWMRCDLDIAPVEYLCAMRLHIFQLLQTVSLHTADIDAGVPARGWHGENYRGHIFWDETFVLSFLSWRFPAAARSILLYRYRRLDAARYLARKYGYQGALFPWRSASTGREETPLYQFNPLSGRWMPDHTHLQHHINAIVAHNVWLYYNITRDTEFLCEYGAELLVEIARFWASIATYNPECDRYEIHHVVGPDEYHTAYPHADTPGINNNTYTNLMAAWTLCHVQKLFDLLPYSRRNELWHTLQLSQDELDHWDGVSRKMQVIFNQDGTLSQYEGFEQLQEFDLQQFEQQNDDQRVDWVIEAQGKDINQYKVAKQADVAMLFFLLSDAEVSDLLERLGYEFGRSQMQQTLKCHFQYTAHQSSLSNLVYAGALATFDIEKSWQLFDQVSFTDLSPEANTGTEVGIHLGAMAGTLHILQHCYLGLEIENGKICLNPCFPNQLERFCLNLHHRQHDLQIKKVGTELNIAAAPTNPNTVQIFYQGEPVKLQPGDLKTFQLRQADASG